MKTEVSTGFSKMEVTGELDWNYFHGTSGVEAKLGGGVVKECGGVRGRNNASEKYGCKGEQRNGSHWREMCELGHIFILIKIA